MGVSAIPEGILSLYLLLRDNVRITKTFETLSIKEL
jgi:hypothetical protein